MSICWPPQATGLITSCRGASRLNTPFPGISPSRSRRKRRSPRSTHPATACGLPVRSRTSAAVELAPDAGTEPGPFRLSFPPRTSGRLGLAVRLPRPQDRRRLLPAPGRIAGPAAKADSAGLKREVTLVIDRSGSMRGEKLAQVREAALQVLAGLDDGEAFNVILYNEGVDPFADRPVRKSPETIKDATKFLEGMTARGGTNIHDALLEALRQPPDRGNSADRLVHDRRAADRRADVGSRDPRAGTKGQLRTSGESSPSASASMSTRHCWRRSPTRAGRPPRLFFPARTSK